MPSTSGVLSCLLKQPIQTDIQFSRVVRNIIKPRKLTNKLTTPTIKTGIGFEICSGVINRFNECTITEKQSANKNTVLIRPPRTSARTQPNVNRSKSILLFPVLELAHLKAIKPIVRAAKSVIIWKLSATKAIDLVTWPTVIFIRNSKPVKQIIAMNLSCHFNVNCSRLFTPIIL